MRRALSTAAGSTWIAANVAGYWRYRAALRRPAETQQALLARYLRANADTAFGRAHRFATLRTMADYQAAVPLASYTDLAPAIEAIARGEAAVLTRDRVRTLALSSGSASAAKRIPYTATLQREFHRAVAPWVVDLALAQPSLLAGCSYWSITPVATSPADRTAAVPVGFDEDSAYLGRLVKPLVDATLAVPGVVRFVADVDAWRYVTLRFLVGRADLALISVWHPTFLTLLLEALVPHWDRLVDDVRHGTLRPPVGLPDRLAATLGTRLGPDRRRAETLAALGPGDVTRIWPRLRIVSCWGDGHAALGLDDVARRLPGVLVQPKGLLATEGVVTLPFRGRTPLAIRSHVFEFLRDGRACLAHELEPGAVYSVVLTTGGGLYRYRLEDRVRVTGYVDATPSLEFLGKEDHVCDLRGEKLNETFVARAIRETCQRLGVTPRFALLAPDLATATPGYTLYLETDAPPPAAFSRMLDDGLAGNPHYQYCRALGQLAPVRVFRATAPMYPAYVGRCREAGQRLGDIKALALSTRADWSTAFQGRYCSGSDVAVSTAGRGRR